MEPVPPGRYSPDQAWGVRLRMRLEELGWSVPELAKQMGSPGDKSLEDKLYKYTQNQVKNPHDPMMEQIAKALGWTEEFLRKGRRVEESTTPQRSDNVVRLSPNVGVASREDSQENARLGGSVAIDHRVPAYGHAMGGPDGEFVLNGNKLADVLAPSSLQSVPDAYAVYVAGESMEPRYYAGEVVFVNPRLPVRKKDFVVAQIRSREGEPELAYVKRFVSLSQGLLRLEQFNPPKILEFKFSGPPDHFCKIHRIVMGGDG